MQVTLRKVEATEKARLRDILADYLQELSQHGEVDHDYPYFDDYWTDDDRWACFIECDGEVAGFAMLNRWSPSGLGVDVALAEFGILPDHRGSGVGQMGFARLLHDRPGLWEIAVMAANRPARAFWNSALVAAGICDAERIDRVGVLVYRFSHPVPAD